jgi:hypothetical protein
MSAYHRTTAALRRSKQARKLVVLPAQCWRCARTIDVGMPFDMGHVVDVASGGGQGPLLPEHRRCNRSAGARLRAKKMAGRQERPAW